MRRTAGAVAAIAPAVAVAAIVAFACGRSVPATTPVGAREGFVGSARCAACHAAEASAWRSSQHALAMQVARPGAVLGRFDGARVTLDGVTTTFLRRGGRYVVNTEGADGALHDYDVVYTFGVWPLQQYLLELPGGRLQALTIAWDARPAARGGQRWYSLTPGRRIPPDDEYHWTGRQYNWNFMCADCHSTAVRKRYDAATDQFHTTFAEIDVGCEQCHGPGATHAARERYPAFVRRLVWHDAGLAAPLTERRGVRWIADPALRTAYRSVPRTSDREIDVCAQCHARRVHIADGYTAGAPLLDHYIPELILPGLYWPDGQQRDEVYNYASFLQSRMYAAGVTCSDCHEPHAARLRRPGNAVCTQCHRAAVYDTTAHHFHAQGGAGAQCVACHMPPSTYMQVDARRDHSMRIPRPDLTVSLGVPDACSQCHTDRDARWAAARVRAWYGHIPAGYQRFAAAFAADDRDAPGAAHSVARIATDATEPAIVRASALSRLARYPVAATLAAAQRGARDPDPLVRVAALDAIRAFPPRQRVAVAVPLLRDARRAVRQGAAWDLASIADSLPNAADRRAFDDAAVEFVQSQEYNADRAGNRLALGAFYAMRARWPDAIAQYQAAVRIQPGNAQAYLRLADALLGSGKRAEAERVVREGIARVPGDQGLAAAARMLGLGRR